MTMWLQLWECAEPSLVLYYYALVTSCAKFWVDAESWPEAPHDSFRRDGLPVVSGGATRTCTSAGDGAACSGMRRLPHFASCARTRIARALRGPHGRQRSHARKDPQPTQLWRAFVGLDAGLWSFCIRRVLVVGRECRPLAPAIE